MSWVLEQSEGSALRMSGRSGNLLLLTLKVPSDEQAALLTEGLVASGATAVEEKAGSLITYLPFTDAPEDRLRQLRLSLERIVGWAPELQWEVAPDRDWEEEWKRGLQPRRVGERLVVAPSWTSPELRAGDLLV